MPEAEHQERRDAAAHAVEEDPSLSDAAKEDYGQKLETIFDNTRWSTYSGKNSTG